MHNVEVKGGNRGALHAAYATHHDAERLRDIHGAMRMCLNLGGGR